MFGGLKSGTGLLLDMGKPVTLSSVQLTFGPTAGTNLTIEIGNQPGLTPRRSFTKIAKEKNAGWGTQTFQISHSASGRYVLIWFTKLPPLAGGGTSSRRSSPAPSCADRADPWRASAARRCLAGGACRRLSRPTPSCSASTWPATPTRSGCCSAATATGCGPWPSAPWAIRRRRPTPCRTR